MEHLQRSKEFFEITGWNDRLKWLQVEQRVENKESSLIVEDDEEDFVSDDDVTRPFSQMSLMILL